MTEERPTYETGQGQPASGAPALKIERTQPEYNLLADGRVVWNEEQLWIKIGVSFGRGSNSMLARLSGAELKTFIAIALRINDHNECHPSIPTIAVDTNLAERTIIDAIKVLADMGLIEVTRQLGEVNRYTVMGFAAFGTGNPRGMTTSANFAPLQKTTLPPAKNNTTQCRKTTPEEEPLSRANENPLPREVAGATHVGEDQPRDAAGRGQLAEAGPANDVLPITLPDKELPSLSDPAGGQGAAAPRSTPTIPADYAKAARSAPRGQPLPKTRAAGENETIARALAEVCGMDFGVNAGRLRATAKRLLQARLRPTPELLSAKYGTGSWWYVAKPKGPNICKAPPTDAMVAETWGGWLTRQSVVIDPGKPRGIDPYGNPY